MKTNWRNKFFEPEGVWFEWLETLVVSALSIWLWINSDFYRVDTIKTSDLTFFWPLFGPLLIAVRYGFANGVICSLIVISGSFSYLRFFEDLDTISYSFGVGIVLASMIVGEFRDYWNEINQKHDLDHDYMRQKLDSFTKNYHLLKASHDQLEQRMAGQKVSLRASVNRLQSLVLENSTERFESMCKPYLSLISEIGGLEVAGIYRLKEGKVNPVACAQIGDNHVFDEKDLMLQDLLETKKLLTPAKLDEHEVHKSRYQVCIPLLDTNDQLQAVVLAERAKFFVLTPANIALLSLVSNYAADLLNEELKVPVLNQDQGPLFKQYIERAQYNKNHYAVDTCVVAFSGIPDWLVSSFNEIINFRRGADVYWHCQTKDKKKALIVLLPLTSVWGAEQYLKRIKELLFKPLSAQEKENLEEHFDAIGPFSIDGTEISLLEFLEDFQLHD